jgi:hypothetical protein
MAGHHLFATGILYVLQRLVLIVGKIETGRLRAAYGISQNRSPEPWSVPTINDHFFGWEPINESL